MTTNITKYIKILLKIKILNNLFYFNVKTQFISITHRRGTMEEADVLYGVTMQEKGVSKLIELQTAELAAKMGLE